MNNQVMFCITHKCYRIKLNTVIKLLCPKVNDNKVFSRTFVCVILVFMDDCSLKSSVLLSRIPILKERSRTNKNTLFCSRHHTVQPFLLDVELKELPFLYIGSFLPGTFFNIFDLSMFMALDIGYSIMSWTLLHEFLILAELLQWLDFQEDLPNILCFSSEFKNETENQKNYNSVQIKSKILNIFAKMY